MAEEYIGSNDFWNTVITVTATAAFTGLTVWAALYVARPKRRLLWLERSNVALLRGGSATGAVGVTYGGTPLGKPRLVELVLKNSGKRDIQQSDFASQDDSLAFDFGASIISVLSVKSVPDTGAIPGTRIAGNVLYVHKSLIASKQQLLVSVLVDGDEDDLKCHSAHLLETPIVEARSEADFLPIRQRLGRSLPLLLPIVVAGTSLAIGLIRDLAAVIGNWLGP
ncbi:hypothetical protein OHB06_00810 [Streptomyces sp. NBC_01604]|uniref:hypothetical protein n=1 Tax=Streptomyces sp. NBC_01604 TaxID=2975894 RepID=UPI003867CEA3